MIEATLLMQGTRPLVVKSDRSVNPIDPLTRELAKLTRKQKKTEDDQQLISRIEFELGLYYDEALGPFIPTGNVHKALVEGARQSKLGRQIEQGCIPLEVRVPVLYDGPRDIEELFASPDHVYRVSVGVGTKRTMRTRPRFGEWALRVPFVLDPEKLDLDVFEKIAEVTGRYIGLGERRPMFGSFDVTVDSGRRNNGRVAVPALA
jgi:hypothetical protein